MCNNTEIVEHGGLKAPKEYWEALPVLLETVCNGCGPGNWKIDLVPDKLIGLSIHEACDIHDFEYYLGRDKHAADERFFDNIISLIRADDNDVLLPFRLQQAAVFYIAVKRCGAAHFGKE